MNIDIKTLRALVVATNSLRHNPEIDPDTAITYELLLCRLRDDLESTIKTENQHREYPIIGTNPPEYIPWDILAPHEAQAKRNHGGQTLKRLAERGGLSWREALAVLKDRKFDDIPKMSEAEAKKIVLGHVAAWEIEYKARPLQERE